MMIVNNVNPTKLLDELIASGINPILIKNNRLEGEVIASNTEIIFADGTDMELVQQIIDAHDPTPSPTEPAIEERLKMAEDTLMFLLMGGM